MVTEVDSQGNLYDPKSEIEIVLYNVEKKIWVWTWRLPNWTDWRKKAERKYKNKTNTKPEQVPKEEEVNDKEPIYSFF